MGGPETSINSNCQDKNTEGHIFVLVRVFGGMCVGYFPFPVNMVRNLFYRLHVLLFPFGIPLSKPLVLGE